MKKLFQTMALLLVMGNAMAQVPTNGLVAYYPFNGDVSDATGNATPGSSVNATLSSDRFGTSNNAYSFNGSDSYLDLGVNASQKIQTNNVSVSVWVKITGDGINYPRIFLGGQVNASYTLTKVTGSDQILWRAGFSGQSDGEGEVYSNSQLSRNVWHHIVATYDGTTSSIYVDGKLDATSIYPSTLNIDDLNSNVVGGETLAHAGGATGASYFDGSIDDLRLYDRSLTLNEILGLFHENCDPYFTENQVISFDGNNLTQKSQ